MATDESLARPALFVLAAAMASWLSAAWFMSPAPVDIVLPQCGPTNNVEATLAKIGAYRGPRIKTSRGEEAVWYATTKSGHDLRILVDGDAVTSCVFEVTIE
jgi:hypothetical protein